MFTQDDNQPKVTNTGASPSEDQKQDVSAQLSQSVNTQPSQQGDINAYQPPATQVKVDDNETDADSTQSQPSAQNQSDIDAKLAELEALVQKFEDKKESQPVVEKDEVNTQDVAAASPPPPASVTPPTSTQTTQPDSEDLADQNIFHLLGAEDGSVDEQEQFLDELQQVIWDDFVQNDMPLLITAQEKVRADEILADSTLEELQKQDQLLEYLDSLIPDLEEIMLEKAMKLKEDLVRERVESMKESFAQDQTKLTQLQEVEQLLQQGKWLSAGEKLNQIA